MRLTWKLAYMGVVLVMAAGASCGGDDSGGGGEGGAASPYAEACAFACTGPTPCDTFPGQGTCEEQCLAETEGQGEDCAECVVNTVTWRWTTCDCNSSPCALCEEYSGGFTGDGAICTPTCTEPSATCNGYEILKRTDIGCRDTCTP